MMVFLPGVSRNVKKRPQECAPIKIVNNPKDKAGAWFSPELLKRKQRCRQAERIWKQDQSLTNENLHNISMTDYHKAIYKAKQSLYANKIHNATHSTKELFKIIHTLANPVALQKTLHTSQEACNQIYDYFVNKIEKIHSDLFH